MQEKEEFIPALSYSWLTAVYDPLIRWTLSEIRFKERLIKESGIQEGHHVLDMGCGTGTLGLMIRKMHPKTHVIGVDLDKKSLGIAKRKARLAQVPLAFYKESAANLSLPDASVDRVVSSLFFHHIKRDEKSKALKEAKRVLKPGGEIHIADWGKPENRLMSMAFLAVRLLDGFETTADSVTGALVGLLEQAGFENVAARSRFNTLFGTLVIYSGRRPMGRASGGMTGA